MLQYKCPGVQVLGQVAVASLVILNYFSFYTPCDDVYIITSLCLYQSLMMIGFVFHYFVCFLNHSSKCVMILYRGSGSILSLSLLSASIRDTCIFQSPDLSSLRLTFLCLLT